MNRTCPHHDFEDRVLSRSRDHFRDVYYRFVVCHQANLTVKVSKYLATLTLAFATTHGFERRTPARVTVAVLIATLYGLSDEFHQSFVGRDPTVQDWLADTVGAMVMATIILLLWRRMAGPRTQV